jgi:ABC-type sugar transport system substrate-binding protein
MVVVAALVTLAGLGVSRRSDVGGGHQQGEYIMVATNIDPPYWAEARRKFEDAARELGVKARFIGSKGLNPVHQTRLFARAAFGRPAGNAGGSHRPRSLAGSH